MEERQVLSDGLIEREEEIELATRWIESDLSPTCILIEGPAGIGKSALIAEVREIGAGAGLRTAVARGSELEAEFSFGVVRQLFEPLLHRAGGGAVLAGAAAPAGAVFSGFDTSSSEEGEDVSFSVLSGLYWLALELAEDERMLLIVDDLHWCDRPSLRFLSYLARRLDGTPVSLLMGLRSTDPGTDPGIVSELASDPGAMRIPLRPLSRGAVGDLIDRRLGAGSDAGFGDACTESTGGNPLLLRQLLDALRLEGASPTIESAGAIAEIGPRAVARTVRIRLSRLPAPATEMARTVAVLGEQAEPRLVAAVSGIDPESVASLGAELTRVELLRQEVPYGFVHPLLRAAVYEEMPVGEREMRHARAARVLADGGAPAERVAAQLMAGPRDGAAWAVDVIRTAARAAGAQGAPDSAAAYLGWLLAGPLTEEDRTEVLIAAGEAEAHSQGRDAVEHLRAAYERVEDPLRRARLAYTLARTLIFRGEARSAREIAREAAAALPPEERDTRLMLESLELITFYWLDHGGSVEERGQSLADTGDRGRAQGAGERMALAVSAFEGAVRVADRDECARMAITALEGDELMDADNGLLWVYATIVLVIADRPEPEEVWRRAKARAHRHGSLFGMLASNLWIGFTAMRHGDLDEASEALDRGMEGPPVWGAGPMVFMYPAAFICQIELERGDIESARRALEMVEVGSENSDPGGLWREARISLLIAEGRLGEALELATVNLATREWVDNPGWSRRRSQLAQVLHLNGRTDEALPLAESELADARRWGAPDSIGRLLREIGSMRGGKQGMEELREAVTVLDGSHAKLERAKALHALGAALRRERKPSAARDPLGRAFELAEACGATALAGAARTELHATGARPRSAALSGPGSLTASERRVADLAVEGRTNKEIAQALYVTPKTVEVHLSNAYRKLDISGRRQLTGALGA
jgi:DNA-binding CsgD family transcriptional regulator